MLILSKYLTMHITNYSSIQIDLVLRSSRIISPSHYLLKVGVRVKGIQENEHSIIYCFVVLLKIYGNKMSRTGSNPSLPPSLPPSLSLLHTPNTLLHTPNTLLHTPNTLLHTPNTLLHTPNTLLHTPNTLLHTPNTLLHTPNTLLQTSLSQLLSHI